MRTVKKIEPLPEYFLLCEFDDGTTKKVDIKPFLQSEAFEPLKNYSFFRDVKSHGYYISWMQEEVDLSADTLWHIGK